MAEVARSSGRKTDLVVLEACFSGTLEALRPFAKGARYALASQLPMSKVGLPWHHILRNIDELGQSPRDLACSIIDLVGGTRTVPSLSLIDLEKLEDLTQELEALALMVSPRTLASALPAGEVGRDAHWGRQLTDRLARFGPGSQSGDLMRVLEELEAHSQNPQEREQIERVRRTLAQTVVSARGDALGGLSVETGSLLFDRTSYVAATGMNAWAEGLAQARPAVLEPIARLTTQVGNGLQRARTFLLRKAYAPPAG